MFKKRIDHPQNLTRFARSFPIENENEPVASARSTSIDWKYRHPGKYIQPDAVLNKLMAVAVEHSDNPSNLFAIWQKVMTYTAHCNMKSRGASFLFGFRPNYVDGAETIIIDACTPDRIGMSRYTALYRLDVVPYNGATMDSVSMYLYPISLPVK